MRLLLPLVVGLLSAGVLAPSFARAAGPATWFDEAVRQDAEGEPQLAFASYRRAAEAGLPEAEFNVGVMLDSGRGVEPDIAQAATWYARAASHGNHRAAYNLGQLYELGQGVPQNTDIARAWFSASDLAAARGRLATLRAHGGASAAAFVTPTPVAPSAGARVDPALGGVEFVWTAQPQPEPVRFYVELRALSESGSREVFSGFTETSSVFAPLPALDGDYAWRVLAVARKASRYVARDWQRFSAAAAN